MNVFVTGATGTLGRPVVELLVREGHRVRALARSGANTALLRDLGAEPVEGDLFDAASLRAAIAGSDAVLHLATKIPSQADAGRAAAWAENDRIRREGTRNIVDAALAAGAGAVLYPSVTFVYPDSGAAWIDAATAQVDGGGQAPQLASTLDAEAEIARFAAAGGRGVVLRMGLFYGPQAPSTRDLLRLARKGIAPIIGPGDAYQSSIWVDDAASAVVAATLRAPAGTYDVSDDEPLLRGELAAAVARAVGRRRVLRVPLSVARLAAGGVAGALARSQRVSNRRFKEATGWAPSVPNAREGLARIAESDEDGGSGAPRGKVRGARAGLLFLAAVSLLIGFWTQIAPRSFYDGFPGFGRAWVSVDGPYNEHLLRDFGATNLALAFVALAAALRPTATLVRLAALSALIWQAPHALYHLIHVNDLPTVGDRVAQTASLLLGVTVALLLLRAAARLDAAPMAIGFRQGGGHDDRRALPAVADAPALPR